MSIELYHGTTEENKSSILANGFKGKLFLTPRREFATDYGECVMEFSVDVDVDKLEIDFDLPNQRTLGLESANNYSSMNYESIAEYIDNGYSVALIREK